MNDDSTITTVLKAKAFLEYGYNPTQGSCLLTPDGEPIQVIVAGSVENWGKFHTFGLEKGGFRSLVAVRGTVDASANMMNFRKDPQTRVFAADELLKEAQAILARLAQYRQEAAVLPLEPMSARLCEEASSLQHHRDRSSRSSRSRHAALERHDD